MMSDVKRTEEDARTREDGKFISSTGWESSLPHRLIIQRSSARGNVTKSVGPHTFSSIIGRC